MQEYPWEIRPELSSDAELIRETIAAVADPDPAAREAAWRHWDSLCKPLRGFGRLEDMVVHLAGVQRTDRPECKKRAAVIFGADNGVVAEGISQTGSEVTAQVLDNMGNGISSICVMSRMLGMDVIPVNIGMNCDAFHPRVKNRPVRYGTWDIAEGPAMLEEECIRAIAEGIRIASECKDAGYELLIIGEMGIGNTTTSAACASVLFGRDPAEMTGRGAGLSSEGLRHKTEVIRKALNVNGFQTGRQYKDPVAVLSRVGGLDIAGMTGCFLGGAAASMPVWIDGVISGIAACFAAMLSQKTVSYMMATHASAEPAGALIMQRLGLTPVLYAGMHLGEGTGAAAVLPLLDQALNVYYGLPCFDAGKVKAYRHLK